MLCYTLLMVQLQVYQLNCKALLETVHVRPPPRNESCSSSSAAKNWATVSLPNCLGGCNNSSVTTSDRLPTTTLSSRNYFSNVYRQTSAWFWPPLMTPPTWPSSLTWLTRLLKSQLRQCQPSLTPALTPRWRSYGRK